MNAIKASSLHGPRVILILAIITTFITLPGLPAFSQTREFQSITAVEFKDGTVIQGKIIEMNSDLIKIQKPGGRIEVRKFSDAKSFVRENVPAETTEAGELLKRHIFEVAGEISYRSYREPDVAKEAGMMYGLAGSYTYHNKIMLKAEGRGSWGRVDYSNSGDVNNIPDYMLEFRGLVGYDFIISKTSVITSYIGIGYRYLNDDISGRISTAGARGYERESNYFYSPVGAEFVTQLGNHWSIGETIEFDYLWWGKQKSHLSDVNPGFNDVENRQKEGYGLRGSITVEKKYKQLTFLAGPFIRYWNIKKSETESLTFNGTIVGTAYEPDNNSTEIGIRIGVKF